MLLLSSHYETSRSLYPVLPLSVLIQQTRPIPVVTECKEPTISANQYAKNITWLAESQNKTKKPHKG